jgi:subtilisin family serine protease
METGRAGAPSAVRFGARGPIGGTGDPDPTGSMDWLADAASPVQPWPPSMSGAVMASTGRMSAGSIPKPSALAAAGDPSRPTASVGAEDTVEPYHPRAPVGMAPGDGASSVGAGCLPDLAASRGAQTQSIPIGATAGPQFDAASYSAQGPYGSGILAAWQEGRGSGVTVALVDDGFDPATTAQYGNFSTALSRSFASGGSAAVGEPAGGFHGTTTSGLIGAAGQSGMPVGIAPASTIIGVKVSFSACTLTSFVQAESYASLVSSVVNNSWAFNGFGNGEPADPAFAGWYASIQAAVRYGRGGLGSVVVFAGGNDRADRNDLALQPVTADYRAIAVAASDPNGTIASYSNPGAAILVSAIGNAVVVPATGGSGALTESGTSYAAPTVAGIVALMLSVNPLLGWRDVQEILADSAYAPMPSAGSFAGNAATRWNGGGMHVSTDFGFGVVDAGVAVNLARAWSLRSTSANLANQSAVRAVPIAVPVGGSASSTLMLTANLRVQHVQVTIDDTNLPVAATRLVLISPGGTQSVLLEYAGCVGGIDRTGGLDLSGDVITSNAFWGEMAAGSWVLQLQDSGGRALGVVRDWRLTVLGDAASVATPLVYTPEFARLAAGDPARAVVTPRGATTIDVIALPGATTIDLNGGAGVIDGIPVMVGAGLRSANANGSTGSVTLIGLAAGGSQLSGGDAASSLTGAGRDVFQGGLGSTTISTGRGGSLIQLCSAGPSQATILSGGSDTIWAGMATVSITDTGGRGDVIYAQAATLSFINGTGASSVLSGSGTVLVQAGAGGGVYYAGSGSGSRLMAGTGLVIFYGAADGDVLTAAGNAGDRLVAGAGAETLSGGTSTGAITLVGGAGADRMIAGAGRTTFVVGTGTDSIAIGGIRDIIEIDRTTGNGMAVVSGFRLGLDTLFLSGFPAAAATAAIASQGTDGTGGTMLQVQNGTRIDLLGIGHVSQSVFS